MGSNACSVITKQLPNLELSFEWNRLYEIVSVEQRGRMFPPVDEEVLRNNPGFANLYKTLTTTVLNPDGSSRHDAEARARGDVQKVSWSTGYKLNPYDEASVLFCLSTYPNLLGSNLQNTG